MDVHISGVVTRGLRARGVDVLTAQEDSADRLADDLLLFRATELGRMLVSHDTDFLVLAARLQREQDEFAGIAYSQFGALSEGELIEELQLMAEAGSFLDWRNQVVFLPL